MKKDRTPMLDGLRSLYAETKVSTKDAAIALGIPWRTLQGIEQGRSFRYPHMLVLAIEALLAKIRPPHEIRYFIGGDNSGHEYLVPCDMKKAWEAWCALPGDDPASWTEPHYAKRFEGVLTFTNPKTE